MSETRSALKDWPSFDELKNSSCRISHGETREIDNKKQARGVGRGEILSREFYIRRDEVENSKILPWVLLCNDDIDSFLFLYDLMLVCSV